ncbi:hypothetical protein Tco_1030121 [Tanacetum coccineum]|uniref:Uncharacterized protein n=1 Tax=Tanacetum coccineum TaxID=301880 RepID=A0ABQ5G5B6_9ASTR
MADENVPAPAPIRSDDQILPFATAFTASTSLDENWFTLDANLLREALEITPIDQAHPFMKPPSGDAIMDFVNKLGYPQVIHFVSSMAVNHLYQPWRAILSMINQCLTGKTSGHDRPRYPVLQMLWGIITSTNVDFAELMWEEFVQAIQTFLTDKANLGSPIKKGRKDKPHIIPYCRFTKLIIYHLGRIHNIHKRSASPFHLAEEDLRLGNLKFIPKGEADEVFGMPIPNELISPYHYYIVEFWKCLISNELISNNIKNAPYYNAYLEMVAKHDQKVAAEKEGKKKSASTKEPKLKLAIEKSSQPAPAPKPKVTKEKPSKASTAKPPKPKPAKEKKIHNIHQRSASPFHLAEEDLRLGNLKFVPKGEADEVFGMSIPNELISNNIKNAPYYNAYLEMVAKHDQKVAPEKEGKKNSASTKQPKPKPAIEKSSKPAPAPKPKVTKEKPSEASTAKPPKPKTAKEKSTKATPLQKSGKGKVAKVGEGEDIDMERAIQMSLRSFQAHGHARVGGVAIQEPVAEAIRPLHVAEGKGKAIVTEEQADQSLLALHTPKRRSTTDQFIFQRRTPATEEASTGPSAQLQDDTFANIINEELRKDVEKQVNLEEKTAELDQDQAGSDPGETHESRPPPEQVQESLKFPADEHVILKDPLSSTGTLSSMKNLEDAYAIGDQFINDKSTDDEPGKLNVEAEVVFMVTVPIYQAFSSVPLLLTLVIDLSLSKLASSTTQAPIFTATTSTTQQTSTSSTTTKHN